MNSIDNFNFKRFQGNLPAGIKHSTGLCVEKIDQTINAL